MLKLIIEKELKEIIGSAKFVSTFTVCAILILLTFYVGAEKYWISKKQNDAAVAEDLRKIEASSSWKMAEHSIFMPPMPMASLIAGISNDISSYSSISMRGESKSYQSTYSENPIYAAFRFLDLDFIFQIVLSLLAILFSYNAINGEKEAGTLALSFSNPISRSKYIIGKFIGSFLALIVPLFIPLILGCLILVGYNIPMSASEWIKLCGIILLGIIYLGVFISLSIFMSILMKQSSSSFLMMLVIWVVSVIILPRTAILSAGRIVDVPALSEINGKIMLFKTKLGEENIRKLDKYIPESKDIALDKRSEYSAKIWKESDEKNMLYAEKLFTERENKLKIQQNLALKIASISPSASFSLASQIMAGTSLDHYDQFNEQSKNYKNIYEKFLLKKTGSKAANDLPMFNRGSGDLLDAKEIPQFKFNPAPLSALLSNSIWYFSILLFYNLIFLLGSFLLFFKYDLR